MKTTDSALTASTGWFRGWTRFWFQPNDPLALGFIRLVAGLVIFYVHLAYCLDMQAFVGKNAWWSVEAADRERHDVPWLSRPVGWDESDNWVYGPSMPDVLPRREIVMRFFRSLPDSVADRERTLAYFLKLLDPSRTSYNDYVEGLDFIQRLALGKDDDANDEIRADWLRQLWEPKGPIQRSNAVPPLFRDLTGEKREEKIREILAFGTYVPQSKDELLTTIEYLKEYQNDLWRNYLLKFILKLPESKPDRIALLDYIEFWGFDPRDAYHLGKPTFSIWFHVTTPLGMAITHGLILICILLFTVGLWTRTTGVLTWLGTISFIHRSQLILFGMDQMQNILLMYLIIGDAGQAFSLDRLFARRRAARAIAAAGGKPVPWAERVLNGPEKTWQANLGIRLLQVHYCIIYMSSGLSKLKGTTWWDYSAGWMSVASPEFSPIHFTFYQQFLRLIASWQPMLALFSTVVVVFTFVLEIGFAPLIWSRLRPYFVIGSILLHVGIALCMGLTCFALLMFCMVISYLPSAAFRERVCWGRVPRLKFQYDAANASHQTLLEGLLTFDGARQIELIHVPNLPEAALIGPDGRSHTGTELVQVAYSVLPMLSSLGWLRLVPGLGGLFTFIYASGQAHDHSTEPVTNKSAGKVGAGK